MCASKTDRPDQAWSYTSIIPAMQEAEVGGLWFEVGPEQNSEIIFEEIN
jgi:hypothetical protein